MVTQAQPRHGATDKRLHADVSGSSRSGAASTLFRPEALSAHADLRFGRPIGLMPLSWSILTGLLVALALAFIILLCSVSYSRKETARGLLRPVGGDVRVIARSTGVVHTMAVSEGQVVEQGALLATISTARTFRPADVRSELQESLPNSSSWLAAEDDTLEAEIAALSAEREAAQTAANVNEQRLSMARERVDAARLLDDRGFISRDEMRRREEAVIVQELAIAEARARAASLGAQIAERRARYAAERGYSLVAPIAGTVSALQVSPGETVDLQQPLMTITAPDAQLVAELYVPSRAIAFVERGQRVRLLYDAFPHQRFGPGHGVIVAISTSVLRPEEVSAALSLDEPTYRVLVELDRGTMNAFGRQQLLQSGMALTADIVLERRTLVAWLLEPILAIRGRL